MQSEATCWTWMSRFATARCSTRVGPVQAAYNLMINELVSSGSSSEFELRRMNMSTFRLLEVMLTLMMKSAKASQEYTYENVLALYDKTFYYADLLSRWMVIKT